MNVKKRYKFAVSHEIWQTTVFAVFFLERLKTGCYLLSLKWYTHEAVAGCIFTNEAVAVKSARKDETIESFKQKYLILCLTIICEEKSCS